MKLDLAKRLRLGLFYVSIERKEKDDFLLYVLLLFVNNGV
ncbi:MAG: hypothetical protein JG775_2340 [Defluviitaleaceae bacterium]|jgi:hypothetical protein|nr:hypothetical protein [Defluviitaleaceae bacterium]